MGTTWWRVSVCHYDDREYSWAFKMPFTDCTLA